MTVLINFDMEGRREGEGGSHNTVEPPNKGHFGNGHFVLFSEAVPISEACHCLTI